MMNGLNFMTFNVRGLTSNKYSAMMKLLEDHRIDIALIQETHLKGNTDEHNFTELLDSNRQAEWKTFWHNDRQYGRARGTAIWIRTHRQGRAPIHLHPSTVTRKGMGRMIRLSLEWSGHKLRIGNVYMPTTSTSNHWTISTALINHIKKDTQGTQGIIFAGDWNFVEDQTLDTTSTQRINNKQEQYLIRYWKETVGNSITECQQETLRQKHMYTQHHGTMAGTIHSRLDRFYASSDMTRYITQPIKAIEIHSYGLVSDHQPVVMCVQGKQPHTGTMPMQKEYMKRIKTAAKCHAISMKEARNAFEAFLTSFQGGIWLSEVTQGALPDLYQKLTDIE